MRRFSLCLFACVLFSQLAHAGEVRVAVATNFLATAQVLAQRFQTETGHRVLLSSGSTGKLYAQIRQGAPFQVFLAADSERPRRLENEGYAVQGSRFTYATGVLVLWRREAGQPPVQRALQNHALARIAIANPNTAPYGRAAQQALTALNLWQEWEGRVVQGENVGQTFQFAATGNVDAAFVALAQIAGLPQSSGETWDVPPRFYDPIEQQAVLLQTAADDPVAKAYLQFLRSPKTRALIRASGYGPTPP